MSGSARVVEFAMPHMPTPNSRGIMRMHTMEQLHSALPIQSLSLASITYRYTNAVEQPKSKLCSELTYTRLHTDTITSSSIMYDVEQEASLSVSLCLYT